MKAKELERLKQIAGRNVSIGVYNQTKLIEELEKHVEQEEELEDKVELESGSEAKADSEDPEPIAVKEDAEVKTGKLSLRNLINKKEQ